MVTNRTDDDEFATVYFCRSYPLLHPLDLDDNKLTYLHAGRYKQLSQFGGQVIKDIIA